MTSLVELAQTSLYVTAAELRPVGYSMYRQAGSLHLSVRFEASPDNSKFPLLSIGLAKLAGVQECRVHSGGRPVPDDLRSGGTLVVLKLTDTDVPNCLDVAKMLLGIINPRYHINGVFEQGSPNRVTITMFMFGPSDEPDYTLPDLNLDLAPLQLVAGVEKVTLGGGCMLRVLAQPGYDPAEVATNVAKLAGIHPSPVSRDFN